MTQLNKIRYEVAKALLKQYGFDGPKKGVDGHETFIINPTSNMLMDISGNEWHYIEKGVVKKVGSLSDKKLEAFLEKKYGRSNLKN